jgi:hypothetical protein
VALIQRNNRTGGKEMKWPISLLACVLLLSRVSFAMPENTVRETALFIQHALAPGYPMGFWIGDVENPATFFLGHHHFW